MEFKTYNYTTQKPCKKWTPTDLEAIRGFIAKGYSAARIGLEFGVSRNAIIGLCHRKKIQLGGKQNNPPKADHPLRHRSSRPRIFKPPVQTWRDQEPPKAAPTDKKYPYIPLLESREHHCHFPIDGVGTASNPYCCGKPVSVGSYCYDHALRCFNPVKPNNAWMGNVR